MTSTAKERPILFSGEMVRAILSGRKTHTRRIVKGAPESHVREVSTGNHLGGAFGACFNCRGHMNPSEHNYSALIKCPFGQPGDRLWVRETWGFTAKIPTSQHRQCIEDGWAPDEWIGYRSDNPDGNWCWKPSIHMPRWAYRINLEITAIHVERLNDISEVDAAAEGVSPLCDFDPEFGAVEEFRNLWESINGPDSWSANPWVWVIEFKRITI